nr:hypothetical protein [Angustibacter aerolatus]
MRGWLTGRLPQEWTQTAPEVTVDKDEITVVVHVDAPQAARGRGRARAGGGRGRPGHLLAREHAAPADGDRRRDRAPLRPQGGLGRGRGGAPRACSRTWPCR